MSSSLWEEIAEDSREMANVPVGDAALKRVSALAQKQQEIELWIERQKERLATAEDELRKIRELDLPEAMDEVGMSEFKLVDGSIVTVRPFFGASIPNDKKTQAFAWLDSHGFGDLIKSEVIAKFSRGEIDAARELAVNLKDQGYEAESKESVHPQTLKAFVREQVESGAVAVPLDLFGAFVGRQTVVKKGK